MVSKLRNRGRWWAMIIIGLLSCVLLIGGFDAWSLSWRTASGQTVPRTPPPTFTPTPSATPPTTPTNTPLPTATSTLAPGAPTPIPRPNPIVELTAEPRIAGPGDVITFICRIANYGNGPAVGAAVVLDIAWPLVVQGALASQGATRYDTRGATAELGTLLPGAEVTVTVRALVQEDAPPNKALSYRAQLRFEGGSRESDEVIVALPWAMLPATGR